MAQEEVDELGPVDYVVLEFPGSKFTGEIAPVVSQVSWSLAPWNLGAFSASATGTLTYRLGRRSSSQFAWYDRSGRQVQVVGPPGDYAAPALSPDETKVAFTRLDDQSAGDMDNGPRRETSTVYVDAVRTSSVWSSGR
jgi:hypothetical protein